MQTESRLMPMQCFTGEDWEKYIKTLPTLQLLGRTVVQLDLGGLGLVDKNITALAEVIKKNQIDILTLDLKNNQFGDEGAIALAEALRTNRYLATDPIYHTQKVHLDDNSIKIGGFVALIKVIHATRRPLWAFSYEGLQISENDWEEIDKMPESMELAIKQKQFLNQRETGCFVN